MRRHVSPWLAMVALCLCAAALAAAISAPGHFRSLPATPSSVNAERLPRVMLWAWERPDDLTGIDAATTGVAFLARTIYIRPAGGGEPDGGVVMRPRMQPLRVAPGTALMAVVRVETGAQARVVRQRGGGESDAVATYSDEARAATAALIADVAQTPGIRALQIDFDATRGERDFYTALLQNVRRLIPASMPLSITALASWCIGDPWIDALPAGTIDEAVPMLFRMGPDAPGVARYIASGREFRPMACRSSVGVSTDEKLSTALLIGDTAAGAGIVAGRRVYVFQGREWTTESAAEVEKELRR